MTNQKKKSKGDYKGFGVKKIYAGIKNIPAFFPMEAKRFLCIQNIIIWIIIFIFMILVVNPRINEQKKIPKKIKKFKEIQEIFFSKIKDYQVYSVFGINI